MKPNVILIMCDQMKANALDLYWGGGCSTPQLRRLAEAGVLFEHAYTPHPLCVPARVSLWTSQYAHTTGARRNETFMPEASHHAFGLWKQAGYHTGLIGKNHCFSGSTDLDTFDTWCEISHRGLTGVRATKGMDWVRPVSAIRTAHETRNNMPWQTPELSHAVTDYPLEDYGTCLIAAQTERFLQEHKGDPFCLWVSFPDPHEPYEVPRAYGELVEPETIELPPWNPEALQRAPERNRVLQKMLGVSEENEMELKKAIAVHYGMIRLVDDAVGRIIRAVEEKGLRDNTIIVFCSDHGDFAGERRMMVKGGVFFDCLTRVPLIISFPPAVPRGLRESALVSLIDIVPTVLSFQGIAAPDTMQGKKLPFDPSSERRRAVVSEYGAGGPPFTMDDLECAPKPFGYRTLIQSLRWREAEGRRKMIRMGDWKYVHDPKGDLDELYHMKKDPWELDNLANEPGHSDIVSSMKSQLLKWSIDTEDPLPVPLPDPELRL